LFEMLLLNFLFL